MPTIPDLTWTPCRRHLMDLVMAIPAVLRPRAHWRMSPELWDRIKADPELKSNWSTGPRGVPSAGHWWLFDIPVHMNGISDLMDLVIPVDCRPPER